MEQKQMSLYAGDNRHHYFWESEDHRVLILRIHGGEEWIVKVSENSRTLASSIDLRRAVEEASKAIGQKLILDDTRVWIEVRPNQNMVLVSV